ncbi:potassium-transporting ATPase subunit KdpC [Clostridium nigeriense]|uniref:potassium-transporting ATPase subunit KdpC n=1 Tax=Clostridium nigeriense TaxID=1805470 RepID=UPI003D32A3EE
MKIIGKAFKFILVFTLICGLIYPIFITGISQILFKNKANGSIIEIDGKAYGSILLAQEFSGNEYMWGRVMNIDTTTYKNEDGEILMYSTPSNLSPASDEYEKIMEKRVNKIKESNPDKKDDAIPVDLVTVSGSGLDPHISLEAAEYQVDRIAKSRNISNEEVENIIDKYTKGRAFGIFGEETVNVLEVNLALDGILK